MERWADPHRVGIDQLLADVGTTVAANLSADAILRIRRVSEFLNQIPSGLVGEELGRLVVADTPRRLVKIVQAVAPFLVLLDGDGVVCLDSDRRGRGTGETRLRGPSG